LSEIDPPKPASGCWFVPYLEGERTPHNDAGGARRFVGSTAVPPRPT
jgi:sugar (pentulose or hexulose) kinase